MLDYESGKVIIQEVDEDIDVGEYMATNYNLDNIYYMTTLSLNLEVNNK